MAGNDPFCTEHERWRSEGVILLENNGAYSMLSFTPATPGGYIVVPREHVERPLQLSLKDNHDLFRLIHETFDEVQRIYEHDVERVVEFYRAVKADPPAFTKDLGVLAQRMLDHQHLRTTPEGFYILANVGSSAGQSVDNHFHFHIVPTRGKNKGAVSIMREALS